MNWFKCECTKKRKNVDGEEDKDKPRPKKSNKKKWTMSDAKEFFSIHVDSIKYTSCETHRYVINSSYLKAISNFSVG